MDESIASILTDDPDGAIDVLVDFIGFVDDTISKRDRGTLSIAEVQSDFLTYLGVGNGTVDEAASSGGSFCDGPYAISISMVETDGHNIVTVGFCSKFNYARQIVLDASGLFDAVPDLIEIDVIANFDVDLGLAFGASLSVNLSDYSFDINLDPLNASLAFSSTASATIALGTLELSSAATVNGSAYFAIEYCDEDVCPSPRLTGASQLTRNSSFYMKRGAEYYIEGDLTLGSTFPGVTVDSTLASFSLVDEDVFDETAPNLTITGFNSSDFLNFSPGNCISLLRMIDR
jgi:hypothetical protein